jgi:hypothetical protein
MTPIAIKGEPLVIAIGDIIAISNKNGENGENSDSS